LDSFYENIVQNCISQWLSFNIFSHVLWPNIGQCYDLAQIGHVMSAISHFYRVSSRPVHIGWTWSGSETPYKQGNKQGNMSVSDWIKKSESSVINSEIIYWLVWSMYLTSSPTLWATHWSYAWSYAPLYVCYRLTPTKILKTVTTNAERTTAMNAVVTLATGNFPFGNAVCIEK